MGCVREGPKAGEGKQQGESGESKHGKMERRGDKGASHMQAGCWSVHLSDQSLHLIAAIYPILLNNFIKFFFFPCNLSILLVTAASLQCQQTWKMPGVKGQIAVDVSNLRDWQERCQELKGLQAPGLTDVCQQLEKGT